MESLVQEVFERENERKKQQEEKEKESLRGEHLCEKCSKKHLGFVVEEITTGDCECCGRVHISWRRIEKEPIELV